MAGNHKGRLNGHRTKAHEGQARSAARKRANQQAKYERLKAEAAAFGLTVQQMEAKQAREKKTVVAEAQARAARLERESRERYNSYYR